METIEKENIQKNISNTFFSINYENTERHFLRNNRKVRKTTFYIVDILEESPNAKYRRIKKRFIFRKADTLAKILETNYFNSFESIGLINRGLFLLTQKEIINYRKTKTIELPHERRLYDSIFIDIDYKDEKYPKIITSYLRKAGINPFVYETKDGYHLYIIFEEGFYAGKHFEKYLQEMISGLNYFLKEKLKIPVDIISYKHPIWLEEIHNKIKDYKTKLVWRGSRVNFWHLRNFLKRYQKPKAVRFTKTVNNALLEKEAKEIFFISSSHFTFIRRHGRIVMRYHDEGKLDELYQKSLHFCKRVVSFQKFKNMVQKYVAFLKSKKQTKDWQIRKVEPVEAFYISKNRTEQKKYKKYKERVDVLHDILKENQDLSINQLSKMTGISKSSLHNIFKRCPREIIINNPGLAKLLLIKKSLLYSSPKTIEKKKQNYMKKIQSIYSSKNSKIKAA